jgi:radical SAM superfamily enzyme YgiQ (UPF0313 family)
MKSKEICFLYHPHIYDMDPGAQVGLGLLLLATYAKQLGAKVRVINAQSESIKKACSVVPKCDALLMYGCLIDKPIIESIASKVRHKVGHIFVGGPIANSETNLINVDLVVKGFGEDFIEIFNMGWVPQYKNFTSILRHINDYPFPDRTLIEGPYGGNIFKNGTKKCKESTTLLTSRGCRFRCAFCTSGSEKFFQEYSIKRIEKELSHCLGLGLNNIRISDDNLVSNKKRLTKLCTLFKQAAVKWRGSIRVFPNSVEMYEMMKEAGCEELSFGIESGDQKVLTLMNKGVTVSQNIKAIENAKMAGILTRALMMMGTPGETKETLNANMRFVEWAKPDMVSLKIFVPYPGTDIYNNPKKYKCKIHLPLVNVNNSAYRPNGSLPKANIDSKELCQEELTRQFDEMKSFLESKGLENRG